MKRLILILAVALAIPASAQVITLLKDYRRGDDPVLPPNSLVQGEDGTLYGMSGNMVYRLQPDGSGFLVLNQIPIDSYFNGRLALSGGTLYGMTLSGSSFVGALARTVFKINIDGTGYMVLKAGIPTQQVDVQPGIAVSGNTIYGWGFKINTDGTSYAELAGFPPDSGYQNEILVSGDKIFGTTSYGGLHDAGTVFSLNTNGTGYTVLSDIQAGDSSPNLTLAGDTLYGVVSSSQGYKVFKVKTDGTGHVVLKEFTASEGSPALQALAHSGGKLYGSTASVFGPPGAIRVSFTVFAMNTDGTGYTELMRFNESGDPATRYAYSRHLNILTAAGGTLFGLAASPHGFDIDGLDGRGGALFRMNSDGTGFEVLKEFAVYRLPDGGEPGRLALSEGSLYGVADGRIFKINTDGTGYTTLRECLITDCWQADEKLTVSGSTIYGTAGGSVFAMNTDGTAYRLLKENVSVWGGLALSVNTLYWASLGDGVTNQGQLFKMNTDGTGYTLLHTFALSDGVNPNDDLTLSGNTIYGTTQWGGEFDAGTVFKLNTDGTGFTVLKHFSHSEAHSVWPGLTLAGDTLFGITGDVSDEFAGTIFRVNIDGTGFSMLKRFSPPSEGDAPFYTNSDGASPISPLVLLGTTLYGSTTWGGRLGVGTLFKMETDGTGFTTLAHLEGQRRDGFVYGNGLQGLVLSGTSLYASELYGGSEKIGALLRFDLIPPLSITRTGADSVKVFWPKAWTSAVLQQKSGSLDSGSWTNFTDPILDDGTNQTVIVNPTGGSQFYRLVLP